MHFNCLYDFAHLLAKGHIRFKKKKKARCWILIIALCKRKRGTILLQIYFVNVISIILDPRVPEIK